MFIESLLYKFEISDDRHGECRESYTSWFHHEYMRKRIVCSFPATCDGISGRRKVPRTFMPVCEVASVMSDSVCPMDCSPPDFSVHGILPARIWSELPCPPSGDLPNPEIEPKFLMSPALACEFFTTSTTWEAPPNLWLLVAPSVLIL